MKALSLTYRWVVFKLLRPALVSSSANACAAGDQVFAFDQLAQAKTRMEEGAHAGKIILRIKETS